MVTARRSGPHFIEHPKSLGWFYFRQPTPRGRPPGAKRGPAISLTKERRRSGTIATLSPFPILTPGSAL
jgi:hypothetical protein